MKYERVYHFLLPKLAQELPAYLSYHNVQHTKDILRVAEHLCDAEKLTGHQKELLLTAVLLHNTGYIKSYTEPEKYSCEMAREILPSFNYNTDDIETVCDIIMSTQPGHKPVSLSQQIISDATLYYLGTRHYFTIANKLYHEYKYQGLTTDHEDWYKKQMIFLQNHEYFTGTAIKEYSALKKQNLQLLTAKRKPANRHKNKVTAALSDWLLIMLGAVSAGFGLRGFLVPNDVLDGGISGIALLLHEMYHFDLSLLIILLNLPILILSYFGSSKTFVVKTVTAIILLAVCIYIIPYPVATHDRVLVAVFGGFFLGLGSGLVIRGGCAIDGSEILAMYTIKKTSFTISEIILAINILIFSVAALQFGLETALYSILTYFAASQTIGYVVEGLEAYTGVTIISEFSEVIKRRLVNELGRGITVYKGERGFLPDKFEVSEDCDIIFTVITRLELTKLKSLVQQSDPKAFVFANAIKEASGGVIKRKNLH